MDAKVRVMRSYDYCHFEVELGGEYQDIDQVNELRKQAALLVDEAVRQYKIAKKAEDDRGRFDYQKEVLLERLERIKATPESDWTIEDAALMRSSTDKEFWEEYDKCDYFYEDDPERDHHFSMLRKFQDVKIKAG